MKLRIVVSVGTHEQPFGRLVRAASRISALPDVEVRLQYGICEARLDDAVVARPYLSSGELRDWLQWADISITQASPGLLFAALESDAWPIVMPRQRARGEHVDDHQVRFSRTADELGLATAVCSVEALIAEVCLEQQDLPMKRELKIKQAWEASQGRTVNFVGQFEKFLNRIFV